MKQAAQRVKSADEEQTTSAARPVKSFRQGGVKVDVWRQRESRDLGSQNDSALKRAPNPEC
jgi:hypothetical protein